MPNKGKVILQVYPLWYSRRLAHQLPIQGHAGSPPGLPAEENIIETIFLYVLIVPYEEECRKHNAELDEKKDAEHPNHEPNFVFVHNGMQASKKMAPSVQTVVA